VADKLLIYKKSVVHFYYSFFIYTDMQNFKEWLNKRKRDRIRKEKLEELRKRDPFIYD